MGWKKSKDHFSTDYAVGGIVDSEFTPINWKNDKILTRNAKKIDKRILTKLNNKSIYNFEHGFYIHLQGDGGFPYFIAKDKGKVIGVTFEI